MIDIDALQAEAWKTVAFALEKEVIRLHREVLDLSKRMGTMESRLMSALRERDQTAEYRRHVLDGQAAEYRRHMLDGVMAGDAIQYKVYGDHFDCSGFLVDPAVAPKVPDLAIKDIEKFIKDLTGSPRKPFQIDPS